MANLLRMAAKSAPPPRSPEREALAAAISRHTNAERDLAATTKAKDETRLRTGVAKQAVIAAGADVETAKRNAAAYLTARMLGEANDAPVSVGEARDSLRSAEDEFDALEATRTALQARMTACESELEWSKRALDNAITDVVRTEPGIRKLLAEYHALQVDLEHRRQVLLWLERRPCSRPDTGLIPHDQRHWDATISEPLGSGMPDGAAPWNDAMERLAIDADAVLPTI